MYSIFAVPSVGEGNMIFSVRSDFVWNYRVLVNNSLSLLYGFVVDATNDVSNKVLVELFEHVIYAQLFALDKESKVLLLFFKKFT